jgi:hypothetical protein
LFRTVHFLAQVFDEQREYEQSDHLRNDAGAEQEYGVCDETFTVHVWFGVLCSAFFVLRSLFGVLCSAFFVGCGNTERQTPNV